MSEESQKYCDLGEEHLRREEPEEALQWYERAIREDPENPVAWGGRGKACYHLGQLERAERYFRRALRFLESRVRARPANRGLWNLEVGRDYLRLLHWRALCHFWMGLYEEAARLFRRVLRLAPSDPLEVRFLLGETYFRMGELDRAAREFESAGDDPDAIFNLGLTWFYKGDFVQSVSSFRRGIFENMHLACRLAGVPSPDNIPRFRGTHPRELDSEDAAHEYVDRCGDLWTGRPILERWLRAIYLHPTVQADLARHMEQIRTLLTPDLAPGEAARIEGENAVLRCDERLAAADREIAESAMQETFRIRDE